MNVLVACEFSGRVRDAFASRGHYAVSCDLIATESIGYHYQGDVREILTYPWDLLIAFPPCTHLALSGARWFKDKQKEQSEALDFVRLLMNADIPRIAIENPVGVISSKIRKPDQIIHPWQFGHGETKATCLWLKNLPKLYPTNIVDGRVPRVHWEAPGPDRAKRRSITYPGIAEAMAEQWGSPSAEERKTVVEESKPDVDENGVPYVSAARKSVQPIPTRQELTRVRVPVVGGDPPHGYVYLDPGSLFQLERFMREVAADPPKKKGEWAALGRGSIPKYVRDLGREIHEAGLWPKYGYVLRCYDHRGAQIFRGLPFEEDPAYNERPVRTPEEIIDGGPLTELEQTLADSIAQAEGLTNGDGSADYVPGQMEGAVPVVSEEDYGDEFYEGIFEDC